MATLISSHFMASVRIGDHSLFGILLSCVLKNFHVAFWMGRGALTYISYRYRTPTVADVNNPGALTAIAICRCVVGIHVVICSIARSAAAYASETSPVLASTIPAPMIQLAHTS